MIEIILSIVLVASVAALLVYAKKASSSAKEIEILSKEIERQKDSALKEKQEYEAKIQTLSQQLNSEKIKNATLEERIAQQENIKEKMERENEIRFKNLANEVLRSNSEHFKQQQESRLDEIIKPLKENIEAFKRTLQDNFVAESGDRKLLGAKIEELKNLQQSIGKEAKELTTALRGNSKVQGDWGEFVLESLLERSGLENGVHYTIQENLKNENGENIRPDVIIKYPDGRAIVVDSKVSLTAFVNLVNAESKEHEETFRKQHIDSVKRHVDELANKNYQKYAGVEKADFVMMFIPNEPAYIAAMQGDNDLWKYAFDKKVIILSPTHLLTVLNMISQLWRQDKITRNIIAIAEESGKMYDKFVSFIKEMEDIESAIVKAHTAYGKAMKMLSEGKGNLVKKAEQLREMGAKASKSLPQNLVDKQDNILEENS